VITGADSFANPEKAINTMDGASLSQPIILKLGIDNGTAIATPTFTPPIVEVYMLEVTTAAGAAPGTVVPTGVKKVLLPLQDYTVIASGPQLIIFPMKPLNPGSYYTYYITDSLKDVAGFSIKASSDYLSYAGRSPASISKVHYSNQSVQAVASQLIPTQEGIALAIGIPKANVIFSDTFRTVSVGDEFAAIKYAAHTIVNSALTANPAAPVTTGSLVWKTGDKLGNAALASIYTMDLTTGILGTISQVLTDSATSPAGANADPVLNSSLSTAQALNASLGGSATLAPILAGWNVYRTTVKLPYFQGVPSLVARQDLGYSANPAVVVTNTHWEGSIPSLAAIKNELLGAADTMKTAVQAALTNAGINETAFTSLLLDPARKSELVTQAFSLVGSTISDSGGRLDADRFITEWNPLPAVNQLQNVPVLLFAPAAGLNTVDHVVIFQHGITASKENAYAIAASLIAASASVGSNMAVIAIDHPIHGERSFDFVLADLITPGADGIPEISANTNALAYMNLGYLTVARDNIRQSIADLLGLRASIGFANKKGDLGIGGMRVSYLGHSLGAITGTNFLEAASRSPYTTTDNSLFEITATGLAMPGGNIANLLITSPSFANLVKFSIGTSNAALAAGFSAYSPLCQAAKSEDCFVDEYLPVVAANNLEAWKSLNSSIDQFAVAAQMVIDPVDPMSVAASAEITDEPIYLVEIVGDGSTTDPADQVIPNAVATEPMVRQMGLADLTGSVAGQVRHVGRFVKGGHSSLLGLGGSDTGAVLTEIQTQYGGFFASSGTVLQVTAPALLCTATAADCIKE
jgi:triacylglycerol lipase